MLYVCGEAVMDFFQNPSTTSTNKGAFQPRVGGSPYNIARAAALSGSDTAFIGALSTDLFGKQLQQQLLADGVDYSQAQITDAPTTLAFVDTSSGSPEYAFFNNGSAIQTIDFESGFIEVKESDILCVGSVALLENPGADRIVQLCQQMAGKLRIAIDPNARPNITRDKDHWLARLAKIFALASIIKLSDEDLEFLAPGTSADDFAQQQLSEACELVLVTLGSEGVIAYTETHKVKVKAPKTTVTDTVGAGDTLMGSCLSWVLKNTGSEKTLSALTEAELIAMLNYATTAAAINCSREGCSPPGHQEILQKL